MILKQVKIAERLFSAFNHFPASLSKLIVNSLSKGTRLGFTQQNPLVLKIAINPKHLPLKHLQF
jgi:hypothetical protein